MPAASAAAVGPAGRFVHAQATHAGSPPGHTDAFAPARAHGHLAGLVAAAENVFQCGAFVRFEVGVLGLACRRGGPQQAEAKKEFFHVFLRYTK